MTIFTFVGVDADGLVHATDSYELLVSYARCRPLVGIQRPISVLVRITDGDVPMTCLECYTEFLPMRIALYRFKKGLSWHSVHPVQ